MAGKKNDLPMNVNDMDTEQTNSITYATEVVATIVGIAANEVEGIASMCNVSNGFLGKNRNMTRGVKVEVGTEEVSCDLYVNIEYGRPIQKVAMDAQESVRKAVENMTGMHVVRVDVHVQGVSFEQENQALTEGQQKARLAANAGESAKKAKSAKKPAKDTEKENAKETEAVKETVQEAPKAPEAVPEQTEEKAAVPEA